MLICVLSLILLVFVMLKISDAIHPMRYIAYEEAMMEVSVPYKQDGEIAEKKFSIPRGTKVSIREKGDKKTLVRYDGEEFYVENKYLVDSLEECVKVDYIYPRRLVNLREKKNGALSNKTVEKGEKVKVVEVSVEDLDTETGVVNWYKVKKGSKQYWINGMYVETSEKLATQNYAETIEYSTYWDAYYGAGYSKEAYFNQIDYKPIEKKRYEDNELVENINSVHVSLEILLNNKDYYLNLNNETSINSLVVELKGDEGYIWYQSDVVKKYYDDISEVQGYVLCSKEELANVFKEFQDDGFYMIARIVTFKDGVFALAHPSEALTDTNGTPVLHNNEYWPSAYSRKAWMYNVDLAKEIATCNVNEIQFDYVRFPDGTLYDTMDGILDFHNTYEESKVSALQGFLMYAREELEPLEVYIAADIFAWPVVAEDDQDIGQFLPAIANVVDVISPMPYTDHFSKGAMNIPDPTAEPEKTLYEFSMRTKRQLNKFESNCIYRTWIQGYGYFSADDMIAQIQGINKAGYQGYMVWFGNGEPGNLEINKAGYIDSKLDD